MDQEPLLSVEIPLPEFAEEDEDNGARTRNASVNDWERRNVIERTHDVIHIRCDLMKVVHGWIDEATDDDDLDYSDKGTLMVFRFRFDPQKHCRRLIRARINIEFSSAQKGPSAGDPPEVLAISPEERWSIVPTMDRDYTSMGGELHLGATSGIGGLATGIAKLEKMTSRDITDATTVTGAINLGSGRNSGASNCAVWTLLENKTRETGLPDSLKVAILVKREDDHLFNAMVTLEAEADLKTRFGSLFKQKVPLDDPVLFNPQLRGKDEEPEVSKRRRNNQDRQRGVEHLGRMDLYDLCEVRMAPEAFFGKTVAAGGRARAVPERIMYLEGTL